MVSRRMFTTLSNISLNIKPMRIDLTKAHVTVLEQESLVILIKSQNNLEEFHTKFYRDGKFDLLLNSLLSQTHSLKSILIAYGRFDFSSYYHNFHYLKS